MNEKAEKKKADLEEMFKIQRASRRLKYWLTAIGTLVFGLIAMVMDAKKAPDAPVKEPLKVKSPIAGARP